MVGLPSLSSTVRVSRVRYSSGTCWPGQPPFLPSPGAPHLENIFSKIFSVKNISSFTSSNLRHWLSHITVRHRPSSEHTVGIKETMNASDGGDFFLFRHGNYYATFRDNMRKGNYFAKLRLSSEYSARDGEIFARDGDWFARVEQWRQNDKMFLFQGCLLLEETLLVMISLLGLRLPCGLKYFLRLEYFQDRNIFPACSVHLVSPSSPRPDKTDQFSLTDRNCFHASVISQRKRKTRICRGRKIKS